MVRKIEDTCQLEICCFDLQSILFAEQAGIQQVELCIDYGQGGLWPGEDLVKEARKVYSGQLSVMIRPRPGSFTYSQDEVKVMQGQIRMAMDLGADGCTFGALTADRELDHSVLGQLMEHAATCTWTFHRSIDLTRDVEQSLDGIATLGIHRVLTSGGPGRAIDYKERLGNLTRRMRGQLEIVAAGSIRVDHLEALRAEGIECLHSAASMRQDGQADPAEINRLKISWCRSSVEKPADDE